MLILGSGGELDRGPGEDEARTGMSVSAAVSADVESRMSHACFRSSGRRANMPPMTVMDRTNAIDIRMAVPPRAEGPIRQRIKKSKAILRATRVPIEPHMAWPTSVAGVRRPDAGATSAFERRLLVGDLHVAQLLVLPDGRL